MNIYGSVIETKFLFRNTLLGVVFIKNTGLTRCVIRHRLNGSVAVILDLAGIELRCAVFVMALFTCLISAFVIEILVFYNIFTVFVTAV